MYEGLRLHLPLWSIHDVVAPYPFVRERRTTAIRCAIWRYDVTSLYFDIVLGQVVVEISSSISKLFTVFLGSLISKLHSCRAIVDGHSQEELAQESGFQYSKRVV